MKSYRPERVANVIRSVVSEAIATRLNDPRIEPLSSVTRVEVSGDLEHAKVWVSVIGDAAAGRRTIAGLKAAGGFVQRLVAAELSLRSVPRLAFHLDESLKKAAETIRIIDDNMAEIRRKESAAEEGKDEQANSPTGDGA